MAGFFTVRTGKLASDEEPFFSSTSQRQTEEIDLWDLGFMFAISEIPKEIGTVQAQKISWSPNSNEKAYSEPITLTNCATMQKEESNNAAFEISQSFKNRRPEVQFLCPVDLDSLHLQGNINSAESFQYVKLSV